MVTAYSANDSWHRNLLWNTCVRENSLAFNVVLMWELMQLLDQRLQELRLLRDWRCSKLGQT